MPTIRRRKKMLLFVIRHGDPIYDPDSLTPKGRLQAQALAKRFAIHGLDRIYSSPLIRAQQTAKPTSEVLHLPVEIEEWTSENLAWQDLSVQQEDGSRRWIFSSQNTLFRQNGDELLGFANWKKARSLEKLDTERAMTRIQKESDAFLERLGYQRTGSVYKIIHPNEERVALFCHQGFSLLWFPYLLNLPPHLFWSAFDVNHAGVSIFEFKNNPDGLTAPRCIAFSDNSHLLLDNSLPYQFQNRIDL